MYGMKIGASLRVCGTPSGACAPPLAKMLTEKTSPMGCVAAYNTLPSKYSKPSNFMAMPKFSRVRCAVKSGAQGSLLPFGQLGE